MEEIEFENGIKRLEHLTGASIDKILDLLDRVNIPYSKEIIELRFGIKDGKEHTLFEVAKIIQEKENKKNIIERYLNDIKQLADKPIFGLWDAEAVRRSEAASIRIIKSLIKNNY